MEWSELLKELLDGKREVCIHIRCKPEGLHIGIDVIRNGEGIEARGSQGQGDLPPQMDEPEEGPADSPRMEESFPASLEQVPISSAEASEPIQGGVNPPGLKGGLWKLDKLGVVASTKKKLVQWAERIICPKRLLSNCGGKNPAERKKSERPWQSSGRAWSRSVLV